MHLAGIDIPNDVLADACRRAGVRRLWLFGSAARGSMHAASDIDVLVERDPGHPSGLFALGGLAVELERMLGREVHVTTLGGVPAEARPRLLSSARLAYAA